MTFHSSTALWLVLQDKNICTIHCRGFFPLPSNIALWKECKKPYFTDGELKQRQTLFSCSYTAYLNQNQTHALFPKVTLPASLRLLYNPIIVGIATYTQLPSWSTCLEMWARSEFPVAIIGCFDLGFCKGLQEDRVGTVTTEPEKTDWEETGDWIIIYSHWANILTSQGMSSKDFLHLHAVTLHYKQSE